MIAVIVIVLALAAHLAGGARNHRRQHGVHPNLYYTYGRGWYGSIRLPGGFRIGHRL